MSSKSKTQFLKLLKEYRSDPKVSYAELTRKNQLSVHERKRDQLQKAFKIMVRESSLEELAQCLDALMEKWQNIFEANEKEVLHHAGNDAQGGDWADLRKIVNAVSRKKGKSSLYKQVEALGLVRIALLITKCVGFIDVGIKDSSGLTCMDCAERMTRKKGSKERAVLVLDFLRKVHNHDLEVEQLDTFDHAAYTFAKEALCRDYPLFRKRLHESARTDTIQTFVETCIEVTHKYMFNMLPFRHIVDIKDEKGKTALQVALERPKDSSDRVNIARWLLLHKASAFNVQPPYREEAEELQEEISQTTIEEEEKKIKKAEIATSKPRRASVRVQRVARDALVAREKVDDRSTKNEEEEEEEKEEEEKEEKKIEEEQEKEENNVEEKENDESEAVPSLKKRKAQRKLHHHDDDGPRDTICSSCLLM